MDDFLAVGMMLGAIIGAFHAVFMFQARVREGQADQATAAYYAIWTFVLWTLFGAYVLAFWLIGGAAMLIVRLVGRGAS